MKRRPYAGEITKEYLQKLGIEYVSTDGTVVIKKGEQVAINVSEKAKKPYGNVSFYDPDIYAATPKEERKNYTGEFTLGIHVLNYVWNRGTKPFGMVVHHQDNNPRNNDIDNLELKTPRENVMEEREESTRELKCNMNNPRSFYEEKLERLEQEYLLALEAGDQAKLHNLRSYKSQCRANLRYWDSHKEEFEEIQAVNAAKAEARAKAELKSKHIKVLRELANAAKANGDYDRWHNILRVINNYEAFPQEKIIHIVAREEEKRNARQSKEN